ncbi:MAG: YdjY domain-containing protein [Planctomycetota bacterium]|nr:YdjY domain-containing protein [Planctomycetota bacterium]
MHQLGLRDFWRFLCLAIFLAVNSQDLRGQNTDPASPNQDGTAKKDAPSKPGPRSLPEPKSLTTPLTEEEKAQTESIDVSPEKSVANAFGPPPQSKAISQRNLWVDLKKKRVYLDGYVTMREGPLEMFACPIGSKEHESIIATLARPSEVHAALLAIGSRSGTPVQFLPDFVPPTGQWIRVWICFKNKAGYFEAHDAKRWVKNTKTKATLDIDWVFSGSGFWRDPNDGREYYRADGGDMICVSNFSTAMMDLPIASSAEANSLQYSPNTPKIPERGTAIRMVLVPIPIDSPVNPVEADPPAEKPESIKTESGSNNANQPAVKPVSTSTLDPPTSEVLSEASGN